MYLCVIIFIVFLLYTCIRYMREYALLFREYSFFISIDDKHRIKVGEPYNPVASAERGRRVPVVQYALMSFSLSWTMILQSLVWYHQ